MNKHSTKTLGTHAENLACRYFKEKKFEILNQNFRCRLGEVDIICRDGRTLVFVEVKSRKSTYHGLPVEAVHKKKQQRIIKTARYYMQAHRYAESQTLIRFDVIGVFFQNGQETIQYIPGAFLAGEV